MLDLSAQFFRKLYSLSFQFPEQISDEKSENIRTKLMSKFQERANVTFDKLAVRTNESSTWKIFNLVFD